MLIAKAVLRSKLRVSEKRPTKSEHKPQNTAVCHDCKPTWPRPRCGLCSSFVWYCYMWMQSRRVSLRQIRQNRLKRPKNWFMHSQQTLHKILSMSSLLLASTIFTAPTLQPMALVSHNIALLAFPWEPQFIATLRSFSWAFRRQGQRLWQVFLCATMKSSGRWRSLTFGLANMW